MRLPVDKFVILGFTYSPGQFSGIYLWLKEKEIDTKGENSSYKPVLFLLSPPDLMITQQRGDMTYNKNKKNSRKGSMNPTSKLNEKQVMAIRNKYHQGGVSHRDLASEFGVGKATITRILSGKNWGWLFLDKQNEPKKPKALSVQTLDPEEWLANTEMFFCKALKARITRKACRQNHEMAMEVNRSKRRSSLVGHPLYESAAKDRVYHCGECTVPLSRTHTSYSKKPSVVSAPELAVQINIYSN
jgi:hypothetical protein